MCSSHVLAIVRKVTLEPSMFLYFTVLALSTLASQNLLLLKVCLGETTAPSVASNECHDELRAQEEVTFIQTWRDLIILVGPVVFVMFAGPWSDNHGRRRKPLMYLPLCGQILSDLLCILNVYFWSWSASVAALSGSVLNAVTGWRSCFCIGAVSYMSDKTSEKSRMLRLGIVVAIYYLATPVGAFVFGLTYNKVGFYGIFALCVLLNMIAVAYLVFFVSENKNVHEESNLKMWESIIDPKQVIQSFKTIFKPREGHRRAVVLLSLLAAPLTMAPLQGEYAVLYFFLRYKFEWDATDYGYYAAYKCLIIFCGTCFTLGVFSRLLCISDTMIGIMSMTTLVIAAVGNAFANVAWELFLSTTRADVFALFSDPVIDFMHGAGLASVYSIISKNVNPSEIGQANSMVGVLDAVYPLVNMPLYNQFYNHTFAKMPGAFFLLSSVYGVVTFILLSVIYILQKKTYQEEISTADSTTEK